MAKGRVRGHSKTKRRYFKIRPMNFAQRSWWLAQVLAVRSRPASSPKQDVMFCSLRRESFFRWNPALHFPERRWNRNIAMADRRWRWAGTRLRMQKGDVLAAGAR